MKTTNHKSYYMLSSLFTLTYVPQLKIIMQLNNGRPGHSHEDKGSSQHTPKRKMVACEVLRSRKFVPYVPNIQKPNEKVLLSQNEFLPKK